MVSLPPTIESTRREAGGRIDVERVVARHRRGLGWSRRPAGRGCRRSSRRRRAGSICRWKAAVHDVAQVLRFIGSIVAGSRLAGAGHVGRADQREVPSTESRTRGAGRRAAAIGVVAVVEPRHDDVTALHQAHARARCWRRAAPAAPRATQGPAALTIARGATRVVRRCSSTDRRRATRRLARRADEPVADANVGAAFARRPWRSG